METRNILNTAKNNLGIIGIVFVAIVLRLIPHPPNFAPIGALALFSGAHMSKRAAIIISLSAMFVSDIFLGFHATMPFVYGSFIAIVLMGGLLKKRQKTLGLIGAGLITSTLFFIVTNFGVWIVGDMYPKTMSGLGNAYVLAIPFFRNTLISDFLYTFSFFYGYKFITRIFTRHYLSGVKIAR